MSEDTTSRFNQVQLVGRLAADAVHRELPSGDRLATFRLVIDRPDNAVGPRVDTIDCASWRADLRRRVGAGPPVTSCASRASSADGSGGREPVSRAATRSRSARRAGWLSPDPMSPLSAANVRSTIPERGFGPNDVDFRGIRTPSSASAKTSATSTGASSTARPPSARRAPRHARRRGGTSRRAPGRPTRQQQLVKQRPCRVGASARAARGRILERSNDKASTRRGVGHPQQPAAARRIDSTRRTGGASATTSRQGRGSDASSSVIRRRPDAPAPHPTARPATWRWIAASVGGWCLRSTSSARPRSHGPTPSPAAR